MQFNVSGLLKEPTGSTLTFDLDETAPAPGSAVTVDHLWDRSSGIRVDGTVTMMRTDDGIWVTAKLACEVVCACSLCLVGHSRTIELPLAEEFYPEGNSARLDDADETQFISSANVLDLLPTVQQYASLGIPMKPMCKQDCEGMCDKCGANLNTAQCTCRRSMSDSRWGPLLKRSADAVPDSNTL